MRSIAALLAVALLVLASCTPGSSDPDPTRAPTAEPSEQRAAPRATATAAPAQTAAPATPDATPTTTAATPEPTQASVVAVVVETATGAAATREEGAEEETKGSGGVSPREPKPPRTDPQPTAAAARAADAGDVSEKEERPYTWYDGDRIRKVWLESDGAEPVFRTESGSLMTLPGGVVLVLDASWDAAAVSAFFAQHGIMQSSVTEQSFGANAFLVDTEPGLPSLELANTLAVQDGVRISSPNWRRQVETR